MFGRRAWRPSCPGESLWEPGKHALSAGKLCRGNQVPPSGEKSRMFTGVQLALRIIHMRSALLLCQNGTVTLCQQSSVTCDSRSSTLQPSSDFVPGHDIVCTGLCRKWALVELQNVKSYKFISQYYFM